MSAAAIPLAAVSPAGAAYHVQRVEQRGAWTFPEHGHRGFCELWFVARGWVEHRAGGGCDRLGPGTLALVRERDRHALAGGGLRYANLVIPVGEWARLEGYLAEPGLFGRLASAPAVPRTLLAPDQRQRFDGDLRLLEREERGPAARRLLAAALLTWLPLLAAGLPAPARDRRPAWLVALLDEIDRRLEEGLTAADLPRRAGVGAAHLARTFRRHLGCTPTAWLAQRRIGRAAGMLASDDRPLAAIAADCGIASAAWFHRAFRRAHGCTPGAWRKRATGC